MSDKEHSRPGKLLYLGCSSSQPNEGSELSHQFAGGLEELRALSVIERLLGGFLTMGSSATHRQLA